MKTLTAEMTACDEYPGCTNAYGYGVQRHEGKAQLAHRVAWEKANGPIPEGLCVLHECDNPPCRNVEHLFLGTRVDNNADKMAKGRHPTGEAAAQKLSLANVEEIRASVCAQSQIAAEHGISQSMVSRIKSGERWA